MIGVIITIIVVICIIIIFSLIKVASYGEFLKYKKRNICTKMKIISIIIPIILLTG